MLILSLDTSTEKGSVAILENENVIGAIFITHGKSYSQTLIPTIDFLLNQLSLNLKDIDGFSVSIGPGSFTGLRIGVSSIKAFSLALHKKVAPVGSLNALAYKLREIRNSYICPIIDAKKGEIFSSLYFFDGKSFNVVVNEGCYKPLEFMDLLPGERIYFIGNGVNLLKDKIEKNLRFEPIFPDLNLFLAEEIGKIGYNILKEGKGVEPEEISILYYRPSEAEIKSKIFIS